MSLMFLMALGVLLALIVAGVFRTWQKDRQFQQRLRQWELRKLGASPTTKGTEGGAADAASARGAKPLPSAPRAPYDQFAADWNERLRA
jgi:hypothetical protein